MIKLAVFDLDDTLAFIGKGLKEDTISQLKEIEAMGVHVAFCSGKTAFYLNGLLRQLELNEPIIIGENGGEFQIGQVAPPKVFGLIEVSKKNKRRLKWVEKNVRKLFNNELWFQHNRFGVAPFLRNSAEFEILEKFINKNKRKLKGLNIYRHADCIEFMPCEINKKIGLQKVLDTMGISPDEMIVVGDGVNDYPMFELAGLSIGVNVVDEDKVDVNFASIDEAMEYILSDKVLKKNS